MRPERLRATLQAIFTVLLMPMLFFFGLGCLCFAPPPTGSDSSQSPEVFLHTRETLVGPGAVMRNHILQSSAVEATAGEAQVANQALAGSFIGLLMPTAADARQPGQLQEGANIMGGPVSTPVAMKQDQTQSDILNDLFPPPPGTAWVALTMSDTHALDSLLSGPVSLDPLDAFFSYQIDFGGTDPCNGCEVQMVTCVPGQFSAFLPPGSVVARTTGQAAASDTVACTQPVSTYITLVDPFNNFEPLPGAPVVAAFGLYGGQPTTSTINGQVELPLRLEHTSPTTLTFDLASIQSDRGWTYAWQDMQNAPITQITVPAPYQPYYIKPPTPNLKVTASGLPTCTQIVDVLSLQATDTVSPSLQARVQAYVSVLPDPATCTLVDVAAFHAQQTAVIVGGDRLTYTLTISNLMNAAVDGVIEQTITPDTAVRGANLPAGCTVAANVVTCQVANIAAQGALAVTVEILGRGGYSGEVRSLVEVYPANAADTAFLDNVHGPLVATVNFASPTSLPVDEEPVLDWQMYLPLLDR